MSWQKIILPLTNVIDPNVVEIGKLGWACYERENKPAGFAMFHASRGSKQGLDDKRLVYLSPVAASLCTEIAEKFTVEPCEAPARDEPDMAFVLGDPLVMGHLQDKYEPEPGSWEAEVASKAAAEAESDSESVSASA